MNIRLFGSAYIFGADILCSHVDVIKKQRFLQYKKDIKIYWCYISRLRVSEKRTYEDENNG